MFKVFFNAALFKQYDICHMGQNILAPEAVHVKCCLLTPQVQYGVCLEHSNTVDDVNVASL